MSELMTYVVVVMLVMLAIGFGIVALGTKLLLRRTPRVTVTLAALCVLLALQAPLLKADGFDERKHARIEVQRQQLAPALEAYRRTHGEYPPTLQAAGLKAPRTPYGSLHYTRTRSDQGVEDYHFFYGNAEINGFQGTWSNTRGKWRFSRNCGASRDVDCEEL